MGLVGLLLLLVTAGQLAGAKRKKVKRQSRREAAAAAPIRPTPGRRTAGRAEGGARGWLAAPPSRFDVGDELCTVERVALEQVSEHGERQVAVGTSAGIPSSAGTGDETMALSQFVATMESTQAPYPSEPKYVFDKGDFLNAPPRPGASPLSDQLEGALPSWLTRGIRRGFFLTLGGDESGVQFHRHNDGWNLLLAGRKRWFLYPPARLPVPAFPAEELPIRDWLLEFYPGLMTLAEGSAARPLECIQREGELLYVPEGWYHATVNLGDTVAVASQRLHQSAADMLHREHWLWSEAKDQDGRGNHAAALTLLEELLGLDPTYNEAAYSMGIVLSKLGRKQEAISGTVLILTEIQGDLAIFSPSFAHVYAHIYDHIYGSYI